MQSVRTFPISLDLGRGASTPTPLGSSQRLQSGCGAAAQSARGAEMADFLGFLIGVLD